MNYNHQRHLVVTFRYIDNLLTEAGHILAAADSASPFAEYSQDASPVQRKVINDYIWRVRAAMGRAMTDLNLPRPAPHTGALWAVQTHVSFSQIAVAKMEPKRMLGYGALSEADIKAIDASVAELSATLARLMSYLAEGSDADLPARLQKLEQTRDEVPLLRELERIVTARGLVALRGTLAMLLDRMENDRFEIGVFGRTSSGKSSLLNHLLGAEILPVGVTPVTAVPTRVQFGQVSRATIEFAQNPPVVVELARLAEFSTEQQNPANAKHVTRIVVEVLAARLREGITWVDTPGLGSLATSGAAETAAYLPRCDLGLVLIDAGATPTQEDMVLVQMLLRSGARVMVLVSKTDLLRPEERQRFVEYVEQQFVAQLGVAPPLYPVSVAGADAALSDAWFEQALQPLLVGHREQAAASLKRKVGLLREVVVNTLEARLNAQSVATTSSSDPSIEAAITALRRADGLCTSAGRAADDLVLEMPHLAEAMIEAAARQVIALWQKKRTGTDSAAEICSTVLRQMISTHTAKVQHVLEVLRRQLEAVLRQGQQALAAVGSGDVALPHSSGWPLFDTAAVIRGVDLSPPAWAPIWPVSLLFSYAQARLRAQWRGPLRHFLDEYSRRLRPWQQQALSELHADFRAHAAPMMTQLETPITAPANDDATEVEADLQRLREFDPAVHPPR